MRRARMVYVIGVCSLILTSTSRAWDEFTVGEGYSCATERPNCYILDVRTNGEWRWVGHPGVNKVKDGAELEGKIVNISWEVLRKGEMVKNWRFLSDVRRTFGKPKDEMELVTMCRSGSRSKAAADALEAFGYTVHNMTHGFEGDKDALGYRTVNGWKVEAFPSNDSATGAYRN